MCRIVVMVMIVLPFLGVGAPAEDKVPIGFEAMERLELLPFLPPNGTQTKQFITYDTSGGNDHGIAKFRRYDQNGEWVFFDEIGPGCLYRQQMNVWKSPLAPDVRIRYRFDDEEKPRVDLTLGEFFGKGGNYQAPFSPPLAYFDTLKDTYAILYYPFPFQKRLKITLHDPEGFKKDFGNTWYQYTYLKYPSGTSVASWPGKDADSPLTRERWLAVGNDPKSTAGNQTATNSVAAPKGAAVTLLELKGPASIASLKISMNPFNKETFYKTRLRITWDGQDEPLVNMPIGCFFGGGGDSIEVCDASSRSLKTLLFGFDGKERSFYAYWPMPFWSSARMEISNESNVDLKEVAITAEWKSSEAQDYPRRSCGYFGAKRTVDLLADNRSFYERAAWIRGHGKVMGLMMYSAMYDMDADEFTYLDGSRTPQMHGDGTEDDHNQGWGGCRWARNRVTWTRTASLWWTPSSIVAGNFQRGWPGLETDGRKGT